ncbi:MAG TPA: helix-turn-helix transcriptional regulator [Kofleriaceae bacterium]|jgi:transcriptional regulator with XRE-family HTH domain
MAYKAVLENLGARVRELRDERELTQDKLAEGIGVSRNFVSMIERGETGVTLETIAALADTLGISISELFLDVHEAPERLASLNGAIAGQPPEVRDDIFAVVERVLAVARRRK